MKKTIITTIILTTLMLSAISNIAKAESQMTTISKHTFSVMDHEVQIGTFSFSTESNSDVIIHKSLVSVMDKYGIHHIMLTLNPTEMDELINALKVSKQKLLELKAQ